MRLEAAYPKPGPVGARLIRACIAGLREAGVELPVREPLYVAVSGGADSLALAHLLAHFGRRVVARERLTLAHLDHGWRGEASIGDARFVADCARRWGVGFVAHALTESERPRPGESWEALGREARHAWFHRLTASEEGWVLTAHHADDLAETVLWRLGTGCASTHGGGIARRTERLIRPLLRVRKRELQAYLEENDQTWREDQSNQELRFLRNRVRYELLPAFERLFPRGVPHLVREALRAQHEAQREHGESEREGHRHDALQGLLGAAGLRARAAHWRELTESDSQADGPRETMLPGGWSLRRDARPRRPERWVLEAPSVAPDELVKSPERRVKRD